MGGGELTIHVSTVPVGPRGPWIDTNVLTIGQFGTPRAAALGIVWKRSFPIPPRNPEATIFMNLPGIP